MTTWPISRSFPIMTCTLLFPTWLLPTMALAIICRNGSEPFERTLLTVLTVCLYHLSSSILNSSTFFFSLSFTFFHLSLFDFINLLSPLFVFIYLYTNSFTFIYLHSHSFYVVDFLFISLYRPSGFSFIHLHLPPLAFIYCHLHSLAFFYLHPPTSTTI